ncbi:MAG: DUF1302 domain-containing protein [Deltaproteobacteria bacterium]|nr:DUF1302 domain-containing protein [Deltaproteobacteria bacterium]
MGKTKGLRKQSRGLPGMRLRWITMALAGLLVLSGTVGAFEIKTGIEDLDLRWDNTFKYNFGYRTKGQDNAILKFPNADDGDRNFNKGIVSNRIDILSEFDIQIKKRFGARFSAAGWYDQRYHGSLDNNSVATSNHLENGRPALGLHNVTKRYFAGPDGELLDAFAFGKFDLGAVPVNLKVGRHTVYWGESLLFSGAIHSVSYAQMPIDTLKAFAVPGSEAKELFRPLFNVSTQAQLTDKFSVAAQYFLEWEPYRLPEAGAYLGFSDVLLQGGESLIAGPVRFIHGNDIQPSGKKDWGLSARWTPQWLDGTIGAYYRRLSDKLPQTQLNPAKGQYFFVYGDSIDLYGLSLAKQILGISVGAEVSYRKNMPLISDAVASTQRPAEGETLGARGNTWHGLVNFVGIVTPPLCDLAAWSLEFTWSRWDTVTQGLQYFKGRGGYTAIDLVTPDYAGFGINFTPTWYQVFPGMDLSMPLSYSRGLFGNSAITLGGNENAGNYSLGVSLDAYSKYRFDLKYIDFIGDYVTGPTGAVTVANGPLALLSDRGMVTFTFKVTF